MKRTKLVFSFSIILFFTMICSVPCRAEDASNEPKSSELHAASAVLIDGDSGRILYEKKGHEKMPMASTTKIMTCLYTLEHGDPDAVVSVSKKASQAPQVKLGMREGETYRLLDLLYSLMLESHNDTAIAIAEAVEGSVKTFCEKMTEEARSFGCKETCFETPNGLDSANHYTTAYELALITREALKNKTFRTIIRTPSYEFSTLDGKRHCSVINHDAFLSLYEGAVGVKTGFTGKAGYCFAGAVESENRSFISVVLACGWPPHKTYKWDDTKKLMNYGTANYHYKTLLSPKLYHLSSLPVEKGLTKNCSLYLKDSVSFLVKDSEQVRIEEDLPVKLSAPVRKDEAIGSLKVWLGDNLLACVPVYTKNSSKKINFRYCFDVLINLYTHCSVYKGL